MKNTKAIFLIILGAFIMATGFAFAGEALDQLRSGPFGTTLPAELTPVTIPAPALTKEAPPVSAPQAVTTGAGAAATAAAAATPATPEVTPPAPKPTIGQSIKNFLGKNKKNIFLTGIGAYIGFALVGTIAGALTGGLFFFAFFALAAM